MTRIILIIGFLFTLSFSASSQDRTSLFIGTNAGYCFSKVKVTSDNPEYFKFKPGFNVGGLVELSLNNHVSFQTQIGFYQMGHLYQVDETLIMMDTTMILREFSSSSIGHGYIVKRNYILNTWLIGYSIGKKFIFKPQIGFYWGIHLKTTSTKRFYININPTDYKQIGDPSLPVGYNETIYSDDVDPKYIPKLDAGLSANWLLGYTINHRFQVTISNGYKIGFVDLLDWKNQLGPKYYSRAITLNFGFQYRL